MIRSLAVLTALALAACRPATSPAVLAAPTSYGRPAVFLKGQGEQRLMRGNRPLFILADSATVGSRSFVAGYEDVPPDDSGRTHQHLHEDEMIFVHRGLFDIRLGDSVFRAAAGATVFIPRGTWVGFHAIGPDTGGFFFVFNTPSFERCLRGLSSGPGERWVPPDSAALARIGHACDWAVKP